MKTKELKKQLAKKTGFYQKDITRVLNSLSELIKESLVKGQEVHINKLGTFYPAMRKEGVYKLPNCAIPVKKDNRVIPKFKCADTLKQALKTG